MTEFNDDDVRRVAEFVRNASGFEYYQDNGDFTPRHECSLCHAVLMQQWAGDSKGYDTYKAPNVNDFKHRPDCLYLVAQDLLTGVSKLLC